MTAGRDTGDTPTATQQDEVMDKRSFNGGMFDGSNAAGFTNPIHNNWMKDKAGKITHFNKDYMKGYMQGFEQSAGFRPMCFPR